MSTQMATAKEVRHLLNYVSTQVPGNLTAAGQRQVLWSLQGGKCAYCGQTMHGHDCTLDHVFAKSHGGPTKPGNLLAVCRTCNTSKADRPLPAFLHQRKATDDDWAVTRTMVMAAIRARHPRQERSARVISGWRRVGQAAV